MESPRDEASFEYTHYFLTTRLIRMDDLDSTLVIVERGPIANSSTTELRLDSNPAKKVGLSLVKGLPPTY
jgi:hypothetical protein